MLTIQMRKYSPAEPVKRRVSGRGSSAASGDAGAAGGAGIWTLAAAPPGAATARGTALIIIAARLAPPEIGTRRKSLAGADGIATANGPRRESARPAPFPLFSVDLRPRRGGARRSAAADQTASAIAF